MLFHETHHRPGDTTPSASVPMVMGVVGGAVQVVVLAFLTRETLPVAGALVGSAFLLTMAWRTGHSRATAALRHLVPAAGIGGVAMLLGPYLDLVRSQPPGTHAGWSLTAMVVACWLLCDAPTPSPHSIRWTYACRVGALLGMVLGMAVAHALLAGHGSHGSPSGHAGHAPPGGASFAFAHLMMVAAMTAGSTVAVMAMHQVAGKTHPTEPTP